MSSATFVRLLCLVMLPMLAMAQYPFTNCSAFPSTGASNVFELRPSDIKVIMAMGDSITTGFGAHNDLNETRGVAFTMGGAPHTVTLANLFQLFNPDLRGASHGIDPAEVCYGTNCPAIHYYPKNDGNNAAKSGAMVSDMISRQINYLTRQLNQNPDIDVEDDWKVLSIMIGANDLCASCTFDLPYLEPDDYQNNLMATLERVRTALPRTFVNLVLGYNISEAYDLSKALRHCDNISRPLFIQCDCLFQPEAGAIREALDARITEFNRRAEDVAAYYHIKAYDDFAVVVQPFLSNTYLTELNPNFLSRLDCFHPSKHGQAAMAVGLWNNMLTPTIHKKSVMVMSDAPLCPTPDTLLYTY